MQKALYINHKNQKCGVYEFGLAIGNAIVKSEKFDIRYFECDSLKEFRKVYSDFRPDVVIYNYHPLTMPWISKPVINRVVYPTAGFKAIQIGTIHEVYQEFADVADNKIFDYHVCADPTLLLKNPLVYKTGRLVPFYQKKNEVINPVPTIGSFGFAVGAKQFTKIVEQVQNEFDEAMINMNISFAKFGDENGDHARELTLTLKSIIRKEKIKLNITHTHFGIPELLDFLAKNDLNVFSYEYQKHRGIASSPDWALAVNKPIAVNKSMMFRHLFDLYPTICIEDTTLKEIINNGAEHLKKKQEEWNEANLIWDYNRIIDAALNKGRINFLNKIKQSVKNKIKRNTLSSPIKSPWVKKEDNIIFHGFSDLNYTPVELGQNKLNRLLDNTARELYKSSIEFISTLSPELIKNKIPEANVQQGFVFDTAYRFAGSAKKGLKILTVGAFEDTASLALKKSGFNIDEIDPEINYDIRTYTSKPSVKPGSYDIIISTSVIEHVKDDEGFVKDISFLLKPGGIAILTCDFHNDYKPGFDIPGVDFRFYTKHDLKERLMNAIPDCYLIDEPDYDCNEYDFTFLNRYTYTFATFVFEKK